MSKLNKRKKELTINYHPKVEQIVFLDTRLNWLQKCIYTKGKLQEFGQHCLLCINDDQRKNTQTSIL